MKTNLVKILALSAMVLTLGACNTQGGQSSEKQESSSGSEEEVAQVVTITELLELDNDYKFALEGKLVTIEHLALQGRYANTIIGGTSLDKTVTSLRGLQIDCAEFPEFKKGSGWGADISATGRVTDVNGRAVLADATVKVNSERDYDNPPADGSSKYSGGLPISYWPAAHMDRGAFDTYLGRSMSGIMFGGVFELASLPEEVSTEKGTSFQVVFPGEYADTEDLENLSLITVNVPDGIGQTGVTKFNEFFKDAVVGDFVDITGLGQYDLANNGGYGILLETFAAQDCAKPNPAPVVLKTWADAAALAQGYYELPLPDLDNEKTFTYKVNTDYVDKGVEDLFEDASFVKVDHDEAVFVEFDFIAKPSDIETAFDEAVADLKAAGFEEDASEAGAAILIKKDGEEVVAQADVFNQDSYVEVDYMALPLITEFDFATFAELKAFYEGRVSALVEGTFATALVDLVTPGTNYYIDTADELYNLQKYGDEEYEYALSFTAAADLAAADVTAYETALAAAGFVEKRMSDFGANGLYNPTSHEFILGVAIDSEDPKSLNLQVLVLNGDALDYVVEPLHMVDLETVAGQINSAVNADILAITGAAASYSNSFTPLFAGDANWAGFTFDGSRGQNYGGYYTKFGLITQYIFEAYLADSVTDVNAAINGVLAKLDGFAQGNFALFDVDGYFNATTNEFVAFGYNSSKGVLTFQFFVLDAKSATYVTLAA